MVCSDYFEATATLATPIPFAGMLHASHAVSPWRFGSVLSEIRQINGSFRSAYGLRTIWPEATFVCEIERLVTSNRINEALTLLHAD